MATATKHTHEVDHRRGFRLTTCKNSHSAIQQRWCASCRKPFCAQCAGVELFPAEVPA